VYSFLDLASNSSDDIARTSSINGSTNSLITFNCLFNFPRGAKDLNGLVCELEQIKKCGKRRLPKFSKDSKKILDICKGFSKSYVRSDKIINAPAEQELRRSIKGKALEHLKHINFFAQSIFQDDISEDLSMFLKDTQIRNAFLKELCSNQLTTGAPSFTITCKNAITKKRFPVIVESPAFTIVFKLSRKKAFYVGCISCECETLTEWPA
jgi:hypothetical protein